MLLFFACTKIEPAPSDIDGLSHYFWEHYDNEEDSIIAEGVLNAFTTIDAANLEEPLRGSVMFRVLIQNRISAGRTNGRVVRSGQTSSAACAALLAARGCRGLGAAAHAASGVGASPH